MQPIPILLCSRRQGVGQEPSRSQVGRKGSNVYEVNQWLFGFGRSKPCLGGLSVSETEGQLMAVMQEGARRGHATLTKRRSNAPKAAAAQ